MFSSALLLMFGIITTDYAELALPIDKITALIDRSQMLIRLFSNAMR